jgi:hypothetical protein
MRWIQLKKSQHGLTAKDHTRIQWVQGVIGSLDPELISQRAVDCNEYARALFFLEPHIESREKKADKEENDRILQSLQNIYTQIDDPDGLEGVSAHLQHITLDQEALNHRKAGRWTAAQTWYEIRLAESPEDADIQVDLLTCLKESGQHGQSAKVCPSHCPLTSIYRCLAQLRRRNDREHGEQDRAVCRRGGMGNGPVADPRKVSPSVQCWRRL